MKALVCFDCDEPLPIEAVRRHGRQCHKCYLKYQRRYHDRVKRDPALEFTDIEKALMRKLWRGNVLEV